MNVTICELCNQEFINPNNDPECLACEASREPLDELIILIDQLID